MREKIKVSELCEKFDAVLIHYGYSNDSMRRYRKVFRELKEFSDDCEYSQKIGSDFLVSKVQEIGGFVTSGEESKNEMYYLRVIRSLSEYYNFGTIFRRHDFKGVIIWPEEFRKGIEEFQESLIENGHVQKYVWDCSLLVKELLLYLDANGIHIPQDIKAVHLSGFIRTLLGLAPKTVSRKISALRIYLRFLYLKSYITEPLADTLPHTFNSSRVKLPTVWTMKEIEMILKAVDLGNPCGKRDYAMLLIMARLGLRVSDIRTLKLTDIDWRAKQIIICQRKTSEQLSLPLPDDVGWAVIDYLKNGRPITDCPNVFVRHLPPFEEFSNYNNLHGMLSLVVAKAKIPPEKKKPTGCHTLRHSLASNLLQNHVDVTTISDILGHVDPNTAKHYLRVDIPDLRLCALSVVEVTENA